MKLDRELAPDLGECYYAAARKNSMRCGLSERGSVVDGTK